MNWSYEFIRLTPERQRPKLLGRGRFFAHDLEAAKATAKNVLRNVTDAGAENVPDAVRLADRDGKEICGPEYACIVSAFYEELFSLRSL
jgi:hypothetical protein